jgi:uncharacterized membrane protein
MKIAKSLVSKLILYDALFVMGFCVWWAYSTENNIIFVIGFFAGTALMDLGYRAIGKKILDDSWLPIFWWLLLSIAIITAAASLGLCNDVFNLNY